MAGYTWKSDEKMETIFRSAFSLFSEKGIDAVAMTDVARKAGVGVASLYRYFVTKDELAIQTAIFAWKEQKKAFIPADESFYAKSGYEQLDYILNIYSAGFEEHKDFTRFIYFFDSYVVANKISPERLAAYENEIRGAQGFVIDAIRCGLDDGSIKGGYRGKETVLYFTLTHALFNDAQKLSIGNTILVMDNDVDPVTELKSLADILLAGIKNTGKESAAAEEKEAK